MKVLRAAWSFVVTYGGRICCGLAIGSEIGAAIWNAYLKNPVDLGSFGAGLAAIITASSALIAAPPAARAMLVKMQLKGKNDG